MRRRPCGLRSHTSGPERASTSEHRLRTFLANTLSSSVSTSGCVSTRVVISLTSGTGGFAIGNRLRAS